MTNKVLIILGPTATGKTDLAINLAKQFNGELIACDSRQIYKNLDIGTGKLPSSDFKIEKHQGFWIINDIKIWLYDLVNPKTQYNVADYVADAHKKILEIQKRKKLPIIVGGTGLYLKALFQDLSQIDIPINNSLRKKLNNLSLIKLQDELKKISSTKWDQLNFSDKNNPRRLIRAIEILSSNQDNKFIKPQKSNLNILKIGLTAPREIIYQKINFRVFDWFEQGIIDEVKYLFKKGVILKRFKNFGLEYSLVADFIKNPTKYSESELINLIQIKVRQYSKRQITWFKKEPDVNWFDITKKDYPKKLENKILAWYNSLDE